LRIAIVYPGDSEVRRLATRENNRFAALFAPFAARGVDALPAVYNLAQANELRDQLLGFDGALVWVNPIDAGHSRAPLDAVLREVAAAGVLVSTHPDVIMKLGTKDVLVDTRDMGWGSDVDRIDTLEQLRERVGERLGAGPDPGPEAVRGHSGIGVWRVQRTPGDATFESGSLVLARHASRGSAEVMVSFDEFVALMAPYFEDGGHMIDQAWQPRLTEGMVRCYLVQDRVAGFGLQAVNALHPPARETDRWRRRARASGSTTHPIFPICKASSSVSRANGSRSSNARSASAGTSCRCCGTAISCTASRPRGRRAIRALRDQRQQRRAVSGLGHRAAGPRRRVPHRKEPVASSGLT
jgi:hypothetical protein